MQKALWQLTTFRKVKLSYYTNLLRQLQKAIKLKRPGELTKVVLFDPDNAPALKFVVAMSTVHGCGFKPIDHSLSSHDGTN